VRAVEGGNVGKTLWPEPWTAELRELVNRGFSGGQISKALTDKFQTIISRSAVISRVARIGMRLHWRPPPPRKPVRKRLHRPPPEAPKEVPLPPPSVTAGTSFGKACGIMELNGTTCRWPIGDPQDRNFFYCGAVTVAGDRYCPRHLAIAQRSDPSARQLQLRGGEYGWR